MAQTENPFFSVVVPTYERPADLKICLESLSSQNQANAPCYEIIVSDDSNSDSSRILIEKDFPHVHWGEGKKIGPAGNRNAGVDRARGEWIVFLDDDCIAQKGYLAAYTSAIAENPDVLVFEGRIFADRPRKTWAEGCPENEHGGMLWTSNLCINRDLYNKMDGLDERFKIAYEDVDFATRLRKQEIEAKFVSNASVCHPWKSLDPQKNWKNEGYQYQELIIFLDKHPEEVVNHSPNIFWRHFFRGIIKEIPYGLVKFGGRGSLFKIIRITRSLITVFKIKKWQNENSQ